MVPETVAEPVHKALFDEDYLDQRSLRACASLNTFSWGLRPCNKVDSAHHSTAGRSTGSMRDVSEHLDSLTSIAFECFTLEECIRWCELPLSSGVRLRPCDVPWRDHVNEHGPVTVTWKPSWLVDVVIRVHVFQ